MKIMPMLIAAGGTLLYHLSQKMTPRQVNPFLSLSVTYTFALCLCLGMLWQSESGQPMLASWRSLNWASIAAGLAVVGIEAGILFAYRAGWNIKSLSLITNVVVAIVLVPVGVYFFREGMSVKELIGICLCLGGLGVLLY